MVIIFDNLERMLARRNLETNGEVQKFIDREVIKLSEPYVPHYTGYLKDDAPIIGTVVGSGKVKYKAPYARRQYYENRGNGQRGKMWFERMKADHKDDILRGALEVTKQ
ncbi:minor capsid protein [Peptoanaerobacter stomatis]